MDFWEWDVGGDAVSVFAVVVVAVVEGEESLYGLLLFNCDWIVEVILVSTLIFGKMTSWTLIYSTRYLPLNHPLSSDSSTLPEIEIGSVDMPWSMSKISRFRCHGHGKQRTTTLIGKEDLKNRSLCMQTAGRSDTRSEESV